MALFQRKNREQSDETLLSDYRKTGNNEPLGVLYNRYIPLLYGVCLKYLSNPTDAEDAVMQLYEQLPDKLLRHEVKCFRTWIYSVMRNHCLQLLRKKCPETTFDQPPAIMETDDELHLFNMRERRFEALESCMEQLPEPQRRCIELFYLKELSYADIATSTGWNLKSVKSYIQNGRRNLKICIEQQEQHKNDATTNHGGNDTEVNNLNTRDNDYSAENVESKVIEL